MKKVKYLIVAILAFMIVIPVVNAKEVDVSNLEYHKKIIVKPDDKIIYDGTRREDNFRLNWWEIYEDEKHYREIQAGWVLQYEFIVPTYEETFDKEIPDGKRLSVSLELITYCGSAVIRLNYSIVDNKIKKIIYNNTFDVANDNPTEYHESETDILLNDIKRDGYKFLGWYKSSDFSENSRITIIDADAPETLNLYAKLEKIEEPVKIDSKNDIEENPNTYTDTYIIGGIFVILMLSTVVVYVYGKKQEIK